MATLDSTQIMGTFKNSIKGLGSALGLGATTTTSSTSSSTLTQDALTNIVNQHITFHNSGAEWKVVYDAFDPISDPVTEKEKTFDDIIDECNHELKNIKC